MDEQKKNDNNSQLKWIIFKNVTIITLQIKSAWVLIRIVIKFT